MEGETSSECSRISSRVSGHLPLSTSTLFSISFPPASPMLLHLPSPCYQLSHLLHTFSLPLGNCRDSTSHHSTSSALPLPPSPSKSTPHQYSGTTTTPLSASPLYLPSTGPSLTSVPILAVPPMMPRETSCQGSLLLTPLLNQLSDIKHSLHSSFLQYPSGLSHPDVHINGHAHIQYGCRDVPVTVHTTDPVHPQVGTRVSALLRLSISII